MPLPLVLALVFGVLASFLFIGAGLSKITGQQAMRDAAAHFSIDWPRYRAIGFIELVLVAGIIVGFWVRPVGIIAGVAAALLMLAAVAVHLRHRDPAPAMAPAGVALLLSAAYAASVVAIQ